MRKRATAERADGATPMLCLGQAILEAFDVSYIVEMLASGKLSITRNGVSVPSGWWTDSEVLLPPESVPDPAHRIELLRRLAISARATDEVRFYHYKSVTGERYGTPKLFEVGTAIITQAFYFSRPWQFGDQTDCALEWDRNLTFEEADAFYRSWPGPPRTPDQVERDVARLHADRAVQSDRFEAIYRPRIEESVRRARVLCLTESPLVARMWREYADQHTGVCFELAFPAIGNRAIGVVPVDYVRTRQVRLSADPLRMAKAVFLAKLDRYSWEREHRVIHLVPAEAAHRDAGYRELDLRGIILGARMDPVHRAHVLRVAREHRPAMVIREARLDATGEVTIASLDEA
jgi:hypothetical protein